VRRRLDAYCEKPSRYDIREGRAMVDAVKRSDRIVQIGFQRRQSRAMREAVESSARASSANLSKSMPRFTIRLA